MVKSAVRFFVVLAAVLAVTSCHRASDSAAVDHTPRPQIQAWSLDDPDAHLDYPDLTLDREGMPWLVYLQYTTDRDTLQLAHLKDSSLDPVATIAGPGTYHQPRITAAGDDALWIIWSQLDDDDWNLYARRFARDELGEAVPLSTTQGNDIHPDVATDRGGRMWVAWQRVAGERSDLFARYYDPESGQWSAERRVTDSPDGAWEPKLAFSARDEALILFDRHGGATGFDVHLAVVPRDGNAPLEVLPIAATKRYEARAALAATPDGRGVWITWELGPEGWGLDARGLSLHLGLNSEKDIGVAYLDLENRTVEPFASPREAVRALLRSRAADTEPTKKRRRRDRPEALTLNLPAIDVDRDGRPSLSLRYARQSGVWRLLLVPLNLATRQWATPVTLPSSQFAQDRVCGMATDRATWLAWPSDRRRSRRGRRQRTGVHLARVPPDSTLPTPNAPAGRGRALGPSPATRPQPPAPHHRWTVGDDDLTLYWGDVHRHTDLSVCRSDSEGCLNEQYRYGRAVAGLDFMATSDHTDEGRRLLPYEWWQIQKSADLFHVDGAFVTFYAYEREQRAPYGHRNILFGERGGPVVYIRRERYRRSPWAERFPVADGPRQISPDELWSVLRATGKRATVISHMGMTKVGIDWSQIEHVDHKLETVVEIYQGARRSYEGVGAPQPTVGLEDEHRDRVTSGHLSPYARGTYQAALARGFNLGVFASSDHISTHTSYGGVYASALTRNGLLDGIEARRTVAATDKIALELSCNGRPLGSIFTSSTKSVLTFAVHGTAPITRVTLVRNEVDHERWEPTPDRQSFSGDFTDQAPIQGENRYYLRVEQADGNMAWTSPCWVTVVGDTL